MYDRVLRSELMESERWLDLHSDTARLVFVSLIPLADDFGNMEGGSRRLWRWLSLRTACKTEADVIKVLSELCDADLVRRYQVDGLDYLHIPRFRNDRTYFRRAVPPSPWCVSDAAVGAYKAGMGPGRGAFRVKRLDHDDRAALHQATHDAEKADSQSNHVTASKPDSDLSQTRISSDSVLKIGIGVGVGIGEKKEIKKDPSGPKKVASPAGSADAKGSRLPKDWSLPPDWLAWSLQFATDQRKTVSESDAHLVADRFRDYWTGNPGAKGRKADWLATWRNWWRTEVTEGRLSRAQPADHDPTSPTGIMRRAT